MDFEIPEEARMLTELVRKFVEDELMPLEPAILERDARGEHVALTPEEQAPLYAKCKELGLWGLDVPEELGGGRSRDIEDAFAFPEVGVDLEDRLRSVERKLIDIAMEKAGGVKTKAAELLGLSFRSLRYRLQKLDEAEGLEPKE